MDRVKVPAQVRKDMSKRRVKELRRTGFVPGNLYGKDLTLPVEIRLKDLVEATRVEGGMHALLDLHVEGNRKASGAAIIKGVQKDPVTRKVLHVDLQHVSMKEKITSPIAVAIVGDCLGGRHGGILEQVLQEIQVKGLPGDLPPKIEADCSNWDIGHVARVGEISLPAGLELVTDPDEVLATVRPPHVHVERAEEVVAAPAEAPAAETGEESEGS